MGTLRIDSSTAAEDVTPNTGAQTPSSSLDKIASMTEACR